MADDNLDILPSQDRTPRSLQVEPEPPEPEAKKPGERDWGAEAKAMGWNENYTGEDKVDAREFVLREPFRKELRRRRQEINELRAAVEAQAKTQDQMLAAQRDKILRELNVQKSEAIKEGDASKVLAVEQQMRDAMQAHAPSQTQSPQEYQHFVQNNEWYLDDMDMKAWADGYGNALKASNPNMPLTELFGQISAKAKNVFPHKFDNPNRSNPPSVEGQNPRSGMPKTSAADIGWDEIPKDFRPIMVSQWKAGAFKDELEKSGLPNSKREAAKLYAKKLQKIGVIDE